MYVYRFLNEEDEIIYIGRTKSLKERLNNHTHLPQECYDEIYKIEYSELNNNDESSIYERYLINKNSPKYNKEFDNNSEFRFELPSLTWKEYKNTAKKNKKEKLNYEDMNLKQKIKYQEKLGNIVGSFKRNGETKYILYKKEELERNMIEYKKILLGFNKYKKNDIYQIMEYIFNKNNNICTIIRKGKIFYNKKLKFNKFYLYDKSFKFSYSNSNDLFICFIPENNYILIYFNQENRIEITLQHENVNESKEKINTKFKHKNISKEYLKNLDYKHFTEVPHILDCLDEFNEEINRLEFKTLLKNKEE